MEKIKQVLTVLGVIVVGGVGLLSEAKPQSELYAKTTTVVEVNHETDEVTCVDFVGEEWVFTGVEDWEVGDICSMLMNDMGTKSIYDDEIVSVRYDGWIGSSYFKKSVDIK